MNICFLGCKDNKLVREVKDRVTNNSTFEFINLDEASSYLSKIDALVVGREPKISKDVIDKLVKCGVIVRNGIGFDNIDVFYARERGISVYNVSQYCINDVAEHTFALLLNYTRNIRYHCKTHNSWGKSEVVNYRLNGKKLGIVGLGKIGKCVAKMAMSFGLSVSYYDPYVSYNNEYEKKCSLKELVIESDFVTIHVPYTDETHKMINGDLLNDARGVVIINTSRGKVVDSLAVMDCLKNGKVKAFLTDVMEEEPPIGNALYENRDDYCNVCITPHVAFDSDESEKDLHKIVCDIIETHFLGTCNYTPVN